MKTNAHVIGAHRWFFFAISVLVVYLFWKVFEPFALVLVTAAIAAIVIAPLERRLRVSISHPKLAAFLMVLLVFVAIVIPLVLMSVAMVQQAVDLLQRSLADDSWLQIKNLAGHPWFSELPLFMQRELQGLDFAALVRNIAGWSFQNVGSIFSSAATFLFHTVLFFIALYYLLVDRQRLYDEVLKLSPFGDRLDADIVKRLVRTVRSVVFGALIVAVVKGVLTAIGMTIFDVPGALIWGAVTILAAQVPLVGVGITIIPAVVYLLLTGQNADAVGLAIWGGLLVGLVDNFLSPYLVERRTNMHSFLILISMLGGLQLFGAIGLVIGPTILAALMVVIELYAAPAKDPGR